MPARIAGTGRYLPAKVLTNDELAQRVATSDEWIRTRTGIHQRHIAAANEQTSDLAVHAAREAIAAASMEPDDIDLIVVATATPDMIFPSTAAIVQDKLGIRHGGAAFDIAAVCSGFVYALSIAESMVSSGGARNALVIGAETYSRILDWSDRGTCVLFGDGAGAAVLVPAAEPGILTSHLHADGSHRHILCTPGTIQHGAIVGTPFVHMDGAAVFKFAVKVMADVAVETLAAAKLTPADVDWVIPHQANIRIMDATMKKLHLPEERLVVTVDRHGNTSAASIPMALDIAIRDGRIRRGQHVLLIGVGGGFTWGSVLIRW
ncbi:MAG: ketoacyl-ACP synthase III [Burkholderiales bacterium]|nr:ketoacyl-ACP synthase III [Burkholderiales bacterium]